MDIDKVSTAIKDGKLERVLELISSLDLESPSELLHGGNLLCDAIEAGHKDIIKLLLDKGANVNVRCEEGFARDPPLITAVRKGDTEVVQMLLDSGANIEVKGQWGSTSLSDAITLGNINMVKLLLDNKADIYDSFFKFSSALDHASKCEKPEIIELLISKGVMLGKTSRFSCNDSSSNEDSNSYYVSSDDMEDDESMNPLCVAIQRGYVYLVEHYLKQGSNVNSTCNLAWKKGYTPLHFACERRKKEVLEVLLRYGADVNIKAEDGLTPLHIAVEKEKAEFVEMLLLCGANVDAQDQEGRTPLYMAVESGDTRTVKTILKYGPDINNDSNRSSIKAAVCGYGENDSEDIIRHLLLYGFSTKTESTDEEVLHEAVQKGYLHFVDDFLKGTNVNSVYKGTSYGREGYTLLHTACQYNKIQMIKYLLIKGADINARSDTGLTPLHVAARRGHGQVVELLLNRGANLNAQDEDGNTALYFAAETGCVSIVKYILKCRPRINDQDMKNPLFGAVVCDYKMVQSIIEDFHWYDFTVTHEDLDHCRFLHHAIMKGDLKIVKEPLKYTPEDALSRLRHEKEGVPLHNMNKRKKIVEMLLEYGADVNARDVKGATPICSLIYGTTRYIQMRLLDEYPEELENIQRKCMEILEILLQHGADPKIGESEGMTVLHYTAACYAGMEEIAKLFLREGVDVKIANEEGATPLSVATYKGNRSLAKLFLEHGGLDFSRRTDRKILEFASEMEYHECFSLPLELHLADINSVDDGGVTALQFAYESRSEELARYLLEYGADVNAGQRDWLNEIDKHYSESAYIIKNHILKLRIAGLKVPVDHFLAHDYELIVLSEECCEEFNRMKNKKIANTTVSFGDILTEDLDHLAAYAENESIIFSVKAAECKKLFPLYSNVIKGFLWRGVIRRGLLERGKAIFRCYCSGWPDLPDVCVDQIFRYLSDQDLRILISSQPTPQ